MIIYSEVKNTVENLKELNISEAVESFPILADMLEEIQRELDFSFLTIDVDKWFNEILEHFRAYKANCWALQCHPNRPASDCEAFKDVLLIFRLTHHKPLINQIKDQPKTNAPFYDNSSKE